MKLSELQARSKGLDINLGQGDSVHIDYRVHFMTEATMAKVDAVANREDPDKLRDSLDLLCSLVSKWDLTDDDGNMEPLETEHLIEAGFSADVAILIMNGMLGDIQVGEESATS